MTGWTQDDIKAMTEQTITDDMLRAAKTAMEHDRIQGFSTWRDDLRLWGSPHYILDLHRPRDQQEIWRGNSHAALMERCEMERLRIGIAAAIACGEDEKR